MCDCDQGYVYTETGGCEADMIACGRPGCEWRTTPAESWSILAGVARGVVDTFTSIVAEIEDRKGGEADESERRDLDAWLDSMRVSAAAWSKRVQLSAPRGRCDICDGVCRTPQELCRGPWTMAREDGDGLPIRVSTTYGALTFTGRVVSRKDGTLAVLGNIAMSPTPRYEGALPELTDIGRRELLMEYRRRMNCQVCHGASVAYQEGHEDPPPCLHCNEE